MALWALTSRLLRTSLRSRMAAATAILFGVGLVLVLWLGTRETHAAGVLLLGGLALVAFLVTGASVGAGSVLPEDRIAGREEWLSTLAPPAWQRRLAAVLAGWGLATALGLVGGLLVGALALALRPDVTFHRQATLAVPEQHISRGPDRPVQLPLDGRAGMVEVDVRPRFDFYRRGQPVDRIDLRWRAGTVGGEREIPARGAVRLDVPAGATTLELSSLTEHVQVRVVGARRLTGTASALTVLGWSGLLLGLLAGAAAPIAVLVSRRTTAQTAAAAAFSLLLLGAARGTLLELAGQVDPEGWMRVAPALLQSLAWVAPDVAIFPVFEEVVAGRLPTVTPGTALLYTAIAAALACLPTPRPFRQGVNT